MLDQIPLSYYALSGLFNFAASLALAIFILSRNPKSAVNRIFSICVLVAAGWGIFHFLWLSTIETSYLADFYLRSVMLFVILTPVTFTHFIVTLLKVNFPKKINIANYIVSFLFCIAAYTRFFANDMDSILVFPYWLKTGPIFHYHLIHFLANVIYSHFLMLRAIRNSSGITRKKVLYVFIGTGIGYAVGILNYLPWYRIPIPPFLNPLASIYVATVTYAIIRHRLMDIEVIIKKATIFAGLFVFSMSVMGIFTAIGKYLLEDILGWGNMLSTLFSIVIILLAYRPLDNWLTNVTDKFLFQKEIDNRLLLLEFMDDVSTELDIDNIVSSTEFIMSERIRTEKTLFCLLDTDSDSYKSIGIIDGLYLKPESPIIKQAKESLDPIYLYGNNLPHDLVEIMKQMKIEVILPLSRRDRFLGVILMGKKISGREYKDDDLDLYKHVASSIAKAIINTYTMQEKVETKADIYVAGLSDGTSHQYNNKFQTISGPVEIRNMQHELILKELNKHSSEEKIRLLTDECRKFFEQNNDVLQHCSDGGEIADSILILTRPERRKKTCKMNDIQKCLPNGINFFRMYFSRNPERIKCLEIAHAIEGAIPKTYSSLAIMTDVIATGIHNSHDSIEKRQTHEKDYVGKIHLTCSYKKESNIIRFTIQDNGVGIRKENMKYIGTPGFTTKGTSHQKAGYGMGVYMMKQLVKIHKGKLFYESEEGNGATCIIDIPVMDKPLKENVETENGEKK
jgi:signal transduction histidine kinase